MKTSLIALAVTAIFAACNNNPKVADTSTTKIPSADTAGLAQFQMWKTQQEMVPTDGMYNGISEFDNSQASNRVASERIVYINQAPAPRTVRRTSTASSRNRSVSNRGYSNGGGVNQGSTTTVPARKKGWSKAAKGTAIGAGSGAVLGAIVSKKKGKGAIIGGLLGAGAGYVIGRAGDKRDGRY
ncbi:MAG: glycine zipper protein [Segetibacter sp.]|nr:glycine zipper protein [Segetibacter sp.]